MALPLLGRVPLTFVLCLLCAAVLAVELSHELENSQHFITRPDIEVPTWNITIYDREKLSPGYWFLSPYSKLNQGSSQSKGKWTAPMIFDQHGELVWSGAYLSHGYNTFDFRVSQVFDKDMLTFLSPQNRTLNVLDSHFEVFKQLETSFPDRGETNNIHDLNFVHNGTRALVWFDKSRNASKPLSLEFGYQNGTCLVYDQTFREANLNEDWRYSYRWSAVSSIKMAESINNEGTIIQRCNETKEGWEFAQANSVDKFDQDGSYLISAILTKTIYRILRSGDVAWRLGGEHSDFQADFTFSPQGHARIHSYNDTHTIISFFDNGDPARGAEGSSRGLLVALHTASDPKTATLLGEYKHPGGPGSYTIEHGSTQVLSNGNVFSGWVKALMLSEHDSDGKLLMEAHAEQMWLKSYRSYKSPFIGRPTSAPDVFAEVTGDTEVKTTVYVSWNGATEVAGWNVFKTSSDGKADTRKLVASQRRTSFETKIEIDSYAAYIVAEAVDNEGAPLGRSKVLRTFLSAPLPGNVTEEEQQRPASSEAQPHDEADKPDDENDTQSWKDAAKDAATSRNGIASVFGVFAVIVGLVFFLRWRRQRRSSWAPKHKHNRKPSNLGFLGDRDTAYTLVDDDDNEDTRDKESQ